MSTTIHERIRQYRTNARMTQSQLGEAIGLDNTAISKIENGARRISAGEIVDIAEALGLRPRDLTSDEEPAPALVFAHRLGVGDEEDASALAAREAAVETLEVKALLDDLQPEHARSSGPGLADVRPPDGLSVHDQGIAMAQQVREDLDLGIGPVGPMPRLLDLFGAIAVGRPLGDDGIDGLCAQDDGQRIVVVNTSKWLTRQRFTFAHELGHLLAGDAIAGVVTDASVFGGSATSARETRANAFAAELLLPTAALRKYAPAADAVDDSVIADLVFDYGVSVQTVYWRLVDAGVLGRPHDGSHPVQQLRPSRLAWQFGRHGDYEEQHEARGHVVVAQQLHRRAIRAYQAGQIGIGPLARLTQVDPARLRAQLEEQGLAPEMPDTSAALAKL